MNISNWQYSEDQQQAKELRAQGYELNVNCNGYDVRFQDGFICGAQVKLPRSKPLHWRHRDSNLRDFLSNAVDAALKHRSKSQKEVSCAQ